MNEMPLYPKNRPLKNLLSDWKKRFPELYGIVVNDNYDYGLTVPRPTPFTTEEKALYDAFVNHWYFAEIGFDTDEEFIFRFNAIWRENKGKYEKLIKNIDTIGFGGSKKTVDFQMQKTGYDELEKKGSSVSVETKTGTDEMAKGVTTTSSQRTSNTGDKLTRTTPNEKLSVAGDSTTTVTDSGHDTNTYDTTVERTDTPNLQDKQTYNSNVANNGTEIRETLTPEDYDVVIYRNSLLNEFALCFEKIFLGVIKTYGSYC